LKDGLYEYSYMLMIIIHSLKESDLSVLL